MSRALHGSTGTGTGKGCACECGSTTGSGMATREATRSTLQLNCALQVPIIALSFCFMSSLLRTILQSSPATI